MRLDKDLSDADLDNLTRKIRVEMRLATTAGREDRLLLLTKRVEHLMREKKRRVGQPKSVKAKIKEERAYWDEIDRQRESLQKQLKAAEDRGIENRVETLRWEISQLPERPEETESERKARERHEAHLRKIIRMHPEACDAMADVSRKFAVVEMLQEEDGQRTPVATGLHIEDLISCCGLSREQAEAAIENWGVEEDFHDDYCWRRTGVEGRPELPLEDQTDIWIGKYLRGTADEMWEKKLSRDRIKAENKDDTILGNGKREGDS